ncbi:hypothetical protein KSP39_PZI007157 [Platanthera zijinensis]|uniref:Transposase (putative) gypsy type domain-containing protein n=1 Tax=Platanthera zijinensis TaxID=2320716 RepID=A0AAP0BS55_9ASPA
MAPARATVVAAFLDAEHKRSEITETELDLFVATHMANPDVVARLPREDERINTSGKNLVVIPIDHFDYGFTLPPLIEFIEILDFFDIVPDQLSPNIVASVMSFIIYLRTERVKFTMDLFRHCFVIRSITSGKKDNRIFKGVVYFGCTSMKAVNLQNKFPNWSTRFLMFEGNLGLMPVRPQVRAANLFDRFGVDGVEKEIVGFLAGSQLDIQHYILMLLVVAEWPIEESKYFKRLVNN